MRKLYAVTMLSLLLSGCYLVHKPDIEQGNIIQPAQLKKVHHNMTTAQVAALMGTPMLVNTFSANRLDYVYTLQKGHADMTEKHVTFEFNRNRLIAIH